MVCSFKKSQNNNIIPITIKVVWKCESKHWCSCGADGQLGGRSVGVYLLSYGALTLCVLRTLGLSSAIIPITINVMTRSHKCKSSFSILFLPKYLCKSRTWQKNRAYYTKKTVLQGCQLSQIIRETPDFEPFFPVSRLESEISRIIAKVFHFL